MTCRHRTEALSGFLAAVASGALPVTTTVNAAAPRSPLTTMNVMFLISIPRYDDTGGPVRDRPCLVQRVSVRLHTHYGIVTLQVALGSAMPLPSTVSRRLHVKSPTTGG